MSMSLIDVNNIEKYFGSDLLFKNVSFKIEPSDHIALIGVNGCGKTTLFKILIDEISDYNGTINKSKYLKLGYMTQHVCNDLNKSAYEEVLTVFKELIKLETEIESINSLVEKNSVLNDKIIGKQVSLNEKFISLGGLTYKNRAKSALIGLGFEEDSIESKVAVLSGGQKAKLQLAKLLLSDSDCLFLDEPTNHLDVKSIQWLESYLRDFKKAFVVISHDRYFLDRVTNKTFEIENNKLTSYNGNYSKFLLLKRENNLSKERQYKNTLKEIDRMEASAKQQKQWNKEKSVRRAESKLKAVEKLKQTLEKPEKTPEALNFTFKINNRSGNDVLDAKGLSLKFSADTVFENVDLEIKKGERVFLLGANGCGKTSLLKILLGLNKEYSGKIKLGSGVDIGYYDQLQTELDLSKTVLDEIWDRYPKMSQTEIRTALSVFLFKGEDVFKKAASLSGGERAKLLLLRLMLSKSNFLILDEPTNHLDIVSCEALENALLQYEGTLLIVSHDRYLINKLADKIYYLSDKGISCYKGNYEDFIEKDKITKNTEQNKPIKTTKTDYKKRKEEVANIRKKQRLIEKTENDIERIDAKIQKLSEELSAPEFASDYERAMHLTDDIDKLKEEQLKLYQLWEELSEEVLV